MNVHPLKIFAAMFLPVFVWQLAVCLRNRSVRLQGGIIIYRDVQPVRFWLMVGLNVWVVLWLLALLVFVPTWI